MSRTVKIDEYFTRRSVVNREAARQATGLSGKELNYTLAQYGFTRDTSLGLKRYKKVVLNAVKKKYCMVITSYLAGSKVHVPFWNSLKTYVDKIDATLVVIPIRYRNPTVLQEAINQDAEEIIDPLVIPYLTTERFNYGFSKVLADVKINPTNLEPLNTVLGFSYGKHLVVGHTTQQIHPLANGISEKTLTAWSTGSCSVPELSDSLAGKKAELHHRYGFLTLGIQSIRSVHACRNGSFIDQGFQYCDKEVKPVAPVSCVMGDIHFGQEDPQALKWAIETAIKRGAKTLFLNDSFDGSTVNHHEPNLHKRTEFFDFVSDELKNHRDKIATFKKLGFLPYLVHSNHTDFLLKWAASSRLLVHRKDLEIYDNLQQGFSSDLLEELLGCPTLPTDQMCFSFRIIHGHERINGARGGIKSYTQTGTRTAYGHTHVVRSLMGHENVGCLCKVDPDYVSGFSSWIHSIGFIYPNDKFQHEIKWD